MSTSNIGIASELVTITPHTLPDDHGRQQFTADWTSLNGRRRSQVSFTILAETAQYFRDAGYEVRVAEVSPCATLRYDGVT